MLVYCCKLSGSCGTFMIVKYFHNLLCFCNMKVSSVNNFVFNGIIACPAQAGEPHMLGKLYTYVFVPHKAGCGFHLVIKTIYKTINNENIYL